MREKLTAIGNSLGHVTERPFLVLLAGDCDTELDMPTDGGSLIVSPGRRRGSHQLRVSP